MQPLADRMRPQTLEEYIGQKHILNPDKLLYKAIKNDQIFSMIFWGPPGVGKTTLARIIANETNSDFIEFSAVNASVAELKKLFSELSMNFESSRSRSNNKQLSFSSSEEQHDKSRSTLRKTIIFIDEIHRFNKAQQDAFLPYVENGTIILIGATTENPSFEVIGALLSRCRVFTLEQLSGDDLNEVIDRALKDTEKGLGKYTVKFTKGAKELLIEGSNGDSRILLNALEVAVTIGSFDQDPQNVILGTSPSTSLRTRTPESTKKDSGRVSLARMTEKRMITITKELVDEALQRRSLSYDKSGEEHYNTISAFIKSMRASNTDAALYYLARMVNAGEDPLFIARRMVIFASEDIGMAQPTALVIANEVFKACEVIGYPECQINLAHGVTYLCNAKKDRSSYEAYFEALADVQKFGNLPIPMKIRNAPTKLMKELGYGKGYEKYTEEDLLPEKLKGKKYYKRES